MRFRIHRAAAVGVIAALSGVVAGCGGTADAPPGTVSTTDFGTYSAQPPEGDFDVRPDRARGMLVESLRLGEHIVFGSEIAPEVAVQRYAAVTLGERGAWSGIQTHQVVAAQPFNPYAGFTAEAADSPYLGEHSKQPLVSVTLMAFPDEQSAGAAAGAMAAADFGLNASNTPVTLPGYPAALTHWIPSYANVGSWMAVGSVVVHVIAQLQEPRLDQLTALLTKTYREQSRRLEGYAAVAPDGLDALPMDRDGLLTRLVGTGDNLPDARDFAVYGLRTYAVLSSQDPADLVREFEQRGVTSIAVSDNKYLYALTDPGAAVNFAGYLSETPTVSEYERMDGVSGTDEINCFQATAPNPTEAQARRFRCVIPHRNVVAEVFSDRESDVRQLAAAQYALLKDGE
ncbi:DUF7373 family lipoprotein [Nocardia otitidiscaviarum]|uniref:DUF7373 family lipoprotein n=1 Tax=Nocardia otitidiscaviarum TaxID=1823 RepID=UPI003F68354F